MIKERIYKTVCLCLILFFILTAICVIFSQPSVAESVSFEDKKLTFLGNTYALNEKAITAAEKTLSFNKKLFGDFALDAVCNTIEKLCETAFSVFKLYGNILNSVMGEV